MGYYVDPENESKEEFLEREGQRINSGDISWDEIPDGMLPVILVDNGSHTAAAIGDTDKEYQYFLRTPGDPRPKTLYLVGIRELLTVSNGLFVKDFATKYSKE